MSVIGISACFMLPLQPGEVPVLRNRFQEPAALMTVPGATQAAPASNHSVKHRRMGEPGFIQEPAAS